VQASREMVLAKGVVVEWGVSWVCVLVLLESAVEICPEAWRRMTKTVDRVRERMDTLSSWWVAEGGSAMVIQAISEL
jgi:hypothetical protein